MQCGIVGSPQSGKTTLFKILTGVESEPVGREPHRGIAKLNDQRLDALAQAYSSRKIVHATVEYVDIPGVKAHEGGTREPYPAAYLSALKGVTMLALVVRAFNDPVIPPYGGAVDPLRDLREAELEFIFNDLVTVERRLERLVKAHDPESAREADLLRRCKAALENEQPLRECSFTGDEEKLIRGFSFLSYKPLLIVLNLDADSVANADALTGSLKDQFDKSVNVEWVSVCAGIEAEIAGLDPEDRAPFLADLGFALPTLDRIVSATFRLLGMITFLTAGEKETRAWPIPAGATAVEAARVIHEDLARGFIRAEVCWWEDLVRVSGAEAQLRKEGKMRLEGKEYIVKDGDTLNIRFNV